MKLRGAYTLIIDIIVYICVYEPGSYTPVYIVYMKLLTVYLPSRPDTHVYPVYLTVTKLLLMSCVSSVSVTQLDTLYLSVSVTPNLCISHVGTLVRSKTVSHTEPPHAPPSPPHSDAERPWRRRAHSCWQMETFGIEK